MNIYWKPKQSWTKHSQFHRCCWGNPAWSTLLVHPPPDSPLLNPVEEFFLAWQWEVYDLWLQAQTPSFRPDRPPAVQGRIRHSRRFSLPRQRGTRLRCGWNSLARSNSAQRCTLFTAKSVIYFIQIYFSFLLFFNLHWLQRLCICLCSGPPVCVDGDWFYVKRTKSSFFSRLQRWSCCVFWFSMVCVCMTSFLCVCQPSHHWGWTAESVQCSSLTGSEFSLMKSVFHIITWCFLQMCI